MTQWRKRRVWFRALWRHGFWLLPTLGILAALAISPVIRWIDRETGWTWFRFTPDGARGVLGALSGSMLTFIIFVVTAILLVVQLATAQLTPRIIALTFERRRTRNVLTFFTFTYTYTIGISSRVTDVVPQFPVALAVILNLA